MSIESDLIALLQEKIRFTEIINQKNEDDEPVYTTEYIAKRQADLDAVNAIIKRYKINEETAEITKS
jgi:hypothetical protein